jgi:dTDP-glucose pyrophosphorylase
MVQRDYSQVLVTPGDTIRRAIELMDASGNQIALVVDESRQLLGTITDGDVRGGILRGTGLEDRVTLVMNPKPVTAPLDATRDQLLALMTTHKVKQMPLLDETARVAGLALLEDLVAGPPVKKNAAVILAGGLGTRLRPLTDNTPKPLLEVGGKPILELILQQLGRYGFSQIFIAINYKGEDIENYFGDGQKQGMSIQYLREAEMMGTAGALSLLPREMDLPCLVVNGDLLSKVDFDSLLDFHSTGGYNLTLCVKEYSFQLPFGVVTVQGNQAVGIQEKPEERRLINAGVYLLEPETISMVPKDSHYDMNQLIESVIERPDLKVGAFPIHEYWMDIGRTEDYRQAQSDYYVHFRES